MTHSPPIPAANQAPYPPIEASGSSKSEKAALVARMKSNAEQQSTNGAALPALLLVGTALAGAIGYAVWSGRVRLPDRK